MHGELAAYLERHNKKRGWKKLMRHLQQPGASSLDSWDELLDELGTRDIDGLTVGKFVEALGHQNVGLSEASLELTAVFGRSEGLYCISRCSKYMLIPINFIVVS